MADDDIPGYTPRTKATPSATTTVTALPPASTPASDIPGYTPRGSANTAPAPSVAMPAALTYDAPNPNAGFWSTVGSKIHNLAVAGNLSTRAADDYLTRGYGDVLQSKMAGSPSVEDLRAQTESAHSQMGAMDPVIGVGTAMVGGGSKAPALAADYARALTGGSKLAGWGAGALAAGGQSAVDAGLGTLGHGGSWSDAGTSAGWGGLIGGLIGATGVGSTIKESPVPGSSVVLPSAKSTAELGAIKDRAYNAAGQIQYPANDVIATARAARNAIAQDPRADAAGVNAIAKVNDLVGEARKYGGVSAERLGDFLGDLHGIDKVPTAAKIAQSHIQNLLDSGSGVGGTAMRDADTAFARFKNSELLDLGFGTPKAAASELKRNPDFYKSPDVNAAMTDLSKAGSWVPGSYAIKHALAYPLAGAVIGGLGGGAHGYASGGAGAALTEGLEGASGLALAGLLGAGSKSLIARRAAARAGPALTQGAPYLPQQPARELARAWLNSRGERGAGY